MATPTRFLSVILAVALLGLTGCSQFYNGAWGFGPRTPRAAGADTQWGQPEQPKEPVPAPIPTVDVTQTRPQTGDDAIAFEDPDRAARMTRGATRPTYAEYAQASPINTLGLYGQIPVSEDAPSSPMDSPGNVRRVTFTTEGADFDVAVHPTKPLIVYASTRHRETADIYIKRISGTAVTQLTDDPANDVMPTLSPDGSKIAFASDRSGSWDIYLMDAAGGQAVQVTNDRFQNLHPSFSPDGSQMIYCSFGGPSGQWELVLIDVDNPTIKQHIGHGMFPEWSPKSDTIVFQRARQKGTRWFSVWTVELVNGEPGNFTEVAASANAAVITPSWSPDGQNIVFCTVLDPGSDEQVRPSQADVWMVRADGSGRSKLTQGAFANLQPVWAADGSIYFVSNRAGDGAENVWTVRPDQALQIVNGTSRSDTATAEVPTP